MNISTEFAQTSLCPSLLLVVLVSLVATANVLCVRVYVTIAFTWLCIYPLGREMCDWFEGVQWIGMGHWMNSSHNDDDFTLRGCDIQIIIDWMGNGTVFFSLSLFFTTTSFYFNRNDEKSSTTHPLPPPHSIRYIIRSKAIEKDESFGQMNEKKNAYRNHLHMHTYLLLYETNNAKQHNASRALPLALSAHFAEMMIYCIERGHTPNGNQVDQSMYRDDSTHKKLSQPIDNKNNNNNTAHIHKRIRSWKP